MKVLQVYNQYRSAFNGEDVVVERTAEVLRQRGHAVTWFLRSSRAISDSWTERGRAFFSGIYSRKAYREMERTLRADRPDIVHVHNVYPLVSPSVLQACDHAGVPVVLSVHNQMFTCPRADHFSQGELCERCVGGHEYHCVLRNCRGNLGESLAYATRAFVARTLGLFSHYVTRFIAISQFAERRLTMAGVPASRVEVLPNIAPLAGVPTDPGIGDYVAFAGRLTAEKGLEVLVRAAAQARVPLRIAGSGPLAELATRATTNELRWLGQQSPAQVTELYRGARCLVLPSLGYEMCPLVILEAMGQGVPVITTRLGGQAELVEDQVTGLLCRPGDADDLAEKLRRLWDDRELRRRLGRQAYEKAERQFNVTAYGARLLNIYAAAIATRAEEVQGGWTVTASSPETPVVCERFP